MTQSSVVWGVQAISRVDLLRARIDMLTTHAAAATREWAASAAREVRARACRPARGGFLRARGHYSLGCCAHLVLRRLICSDFI